MPLSGRETTVQNGNLKLWPEINKMYLSDVTHAYSWNTHSKYFLTFTHKETKWITLLLNICIFFHKTAFDAAVMDALQYLYHYFILMQHVT